MVDEKTKELYNECHGVCYMCNAENSCTDKEAVLSYRKSLIHRAIHEKGFNLQKELGVDE